jgi:hypothetical protein
MFAKSFAQGSSSRHPEAAKMMEYLLAIQCVLAQLLHSVEKVNSDQSGHW